MQGWLPPCRSWGLVNGWPPSANSKARSVRTDQGKVSPRLKLTFLESYTPPSQPESKPLRLAGFQPLIWSCQSHRLATHCTFVISGYMRFFFSFDNSLGSGKFPEPHCLDPWFSTILVLRPFNTVPHGVVTPIIKSFSLPPLRVIM